MAKARPIRKPPAKGIRARHSELPVIRYAPTAKVRGAGSPPVGLRRRPSRPFNRATHGRYALRSAEVGEVDYNFTYHGQGAPGRAPAVSIGKGPELRGNHDRRGAAPPTADCVFPQYDDAPRTRRPSEGSDPTRPRGLRLRRGSGTTRKAARSIQPGQLESGGREIAVAASCELRFASEVSKSSPASRDRRETGDELVDIRGRPAPQPNPALERSLDRNFPSPALHLHEKERRHLPDEHRSAAQRTDRLRSEQTLRFVILIRGDFDRDKRGFIPNSCERNYGAA